MAERSDKLCQRTSHSADEADQPPNKSLSVFAVFKSWQLSRAGPLLERVLARPGFTERDGNSNVVMEQALARTARYRNKMHTSCQQLLYINSWVTEFQQVWGH